MQRGSILFQPSSHPLGTPPIRLGRPRLTPQNLARGTLSTGKHLDAPLTFKSAVERPQLDHSTLRPQYLLPVPRPEPIRLRRPVRLLHTYLRRGDGDRRDLNQRDGWVSDCDREEQSRLYASPIFVGGEVFAQCSGLIIKVLVY